MTNTHYTYLRPTTPYEACSLIDKHGKEAFLLAGGTDAIPQIKEGLIPPKYCVGLCFIPELDYIRFNKESILIGALTRVAEL